MATKSSKQKLLEQKEVADERYFNEVKARQLAEKAEVEERLAKEQLQEAHQQLQAYAENLEQLVGEKSAQLVEEEKIRRVYQVRAAQADAVVRFLHQTSNLVLQPLASTMIVVEDFIDIIEDCKSQWAQSLSDEDLYQELDGSLARVKESYPAASQVIDGYRELFHAFYEVYVSTEPVRDLNQDLRFIETLVANKYILTNVTLELELDEEVPKMHIEGGVQSIFLELMHNAAKQGAHRLLVSSAFDADSGRINFAVYNDGEPVAVGQEDKVHSSVIERNSHGFGLVDARYIIEELNNGQLSLANSDRDGYVTRVLVTFSVAKPLYGREH